MSEYAWSVPGGLVERPGIVPGAPEIWVYADRFSYFGGDTVSIRVHTTAEEYDLEIVRDGARPQQVAQYFGLPGKQQQTPADAYAVGCDWSESLAVEIDPKWTSGMYLVLVRMLHEGVTIEREGFFVVKAREPEHADFVLIHTTSTMLAYNDWGGANHYRGVPDGSGDVPTPISSTQRPVARGMLRKPEGAARNIHTDTPGIGWIPRHPPYEWAWVNGYSRHHADAFWATYERPFTVWAEEQGFRVHHVTQHDLHYDPSALQGYSCAVVVGHDEYWSWEMRDRIDDFVEEGGGLARFGGNFLWQVRLANDAQVCYKNPFDDPMREVDPTRVTTAWDSPEVARPGAWTMGLTGMAGVYNRYGATTPRSSGGFTVYRPDHWALNGTDLYYGDNFGSPRSVLPDSRWTAWISRSGRASRMRPASTALPRIWRSSRWRRQFRVRGTNGTGKFRSVRLSPKCRESSNASMAVSLQITFVISNTDREWSPVTSEVSAPCSTQVPPNG